VSFTVRPPYPPAVWSFNEAIFFLWTLSVRKDLVRGRGVRNVARLCIILGCECTGTEDGGWPRGTGHACAVCGPYWGYRPPESPGQTERDEQCLSID
jgi:hypothetical protein